MPSPNTISQAQSEPVITSEVPQPSNRLFSLDAFRGATMALMVLVNNGVGPGTYPELQHAEWNGWTLTDTVFPSFLWIVGVAITLSLGKRLQAGASKGKLFSQVLRRAFLLYVLGLISYAIPDFNLGTQRLLGVLQRIAICYLIASAIYLTTRLRTQLIWMAGLLVAYWILMTLVPVPGYGPGNLSVEGNFAHYVDWNVLGAHNYSPTKTWDPEGIISTIPAIVTALLGVMAGHILRLKRDLTERVVWLFLIGTLLVVAGRICNIWLPINKKLWTDSFAFFMAGLDFIVFAISVWCLDALKLRRGIKPLVIMGMNAITVYMASELLAILLDVVRVGGRPLRDWLYRNVYSVIASPANASLLYALSFVLVMYALAYGLYRRGWFLKV